MTSASAKPCSISPNANWWRAAMLEAFSGGGLTPLVIKSSCSSGALGSMACFQVMTGFSTWYSTSISSAARAAISGVVAATAATACPSYMVLRRAMTFSDISWKLTVTSPAAMSPGPSSGKSAAVTTAFTPGSARAFLMLMDLILAWACGLRTTRPWIMSATVRSAPKLARPVTLSTPSGRIGRVPMTRYLLLPSPRILLCCSSLPMVHAPRISAAAFITALIILS